MKILITGTSGFLGKRLVREYRTRYDVYATTHQTMDFTEWNQVESVFEKIRPRVVIHCGAISDVNVCNRERELSEKINVDGTKNLAMACRKFDARMIFCSSDQVYINEWKPEFGADYWRPHEETEILRPIPIYGQQKLRAEQLCLQEQPDSIILRLTLMYDKPDEDEKKKNKGVFAETLKNNLKRNITQEFFTTNFRGITDCKEVVVNMEKAMKLPAGVYNFGSNNENSMYETMKSIFQDFGKSDLIKESKPGEHRNLLMSTQKINDFGIKFETTIQGLKRYLLS